MLLFFVLLAVSFAHAMFNIDSIGPDRFDFIIVGAGPAGELALLNAKSSL